MHVDQYHYLYQPFYIIGTPLYANEATISIMLYVIF